MTEPSTSERIVLFPTKKAFKEALNFGVRIYCKDTSFHQAVDYVLHPTDKDKASMVQDFLKPAESIIVTNDKHAWFARVTRNIADNGYAVE